MTRETGITVKMLDMVAIAEELSKVSDTKVDPDHLLTTGIITNRAGMVRTINGEGVMDRGYENGVFTNRFAVYTWGGHVTMSLEELMSFVTEETVNLDEFIRVFGARLETNFYLAAQFTKGVEA